MRAWLLSPFATWFATLTLGFGLGLSAAGERWALLPFGISGVLQYAIARVRRAGGMRP